MKLLKQLATIGYALSLSSMASAVTYTTSIEFTYGSSTSSNALVEGKINFVSEDTSNPTYKMYPGVLKLNVTDYKITVSGTKFSSGVYTESNSTITNNPGYRPIEINGFLMNTSQKEDITANYTPGDNSSWITLDDLLEFAPTIYQDGKAVLISSYPPPYLVQMTTNGVKEPCPTSSHQCIDNSTGVYQNTDRLFMTSFVRTAPVQEVPVPAAIWLFGSALAGLSQLRKKAV